jgi:cell division protein FtsI/penicillin-binding protein 2
MARVTVAVANGGTLVAPTLEKGRQGAQKTILSHEVTDIVRDAMRETVTGGTARIMQDIPVEVAGKTGTAQWSATYAPHSWFTGFAPFEDPQIVIAVIVEQGGDLTLATPVAHDILQWYFSQETVQP